MAAQVMPTLMTRRDDDCSDLNWSGKYCCLYPFDPSDYCNFWDALANLGGLNQEVGHQAACQKWIEGCNAS